MQCVRSVRPVSMFDAISVVCPARWWRVFLLHVGQIFTSAEKKWKVVLQARQSPPVEWYWVTRNCIYTYFVKYLSYWKSFWVNAAKLKDFSILFQVWICVQAIAEKVYYVQFQLNVLVKYTSYCINTTRIKFGFWESTSDHVRRRQMFVCILCADRKQLRTYTWNYSLSCNSNITIL